MRQATGSNTPQSGNKVSIQLSLDGHSFSVPALSELPAGEAPVTVELLLPRTMLVPPTAEESVVASDPEAEFVAVTAINREALRQVEEKLGDRIRYTTPLLREVQAGTPTVWAYRTAGLLYIKVYDGSLRFAGVEFALKSCELRISGDDAKACGKLLKGYFKRIVCE